MTKLTRRTRRRKRRRTTARFAIPPAADRWDLTAEEVVRDLDPHWGRWRQRGDC